MKRILLIGALAVSALTAADNNTPDYMYQGTSTTAVTIQRPAAANKQLKFYRAWIYCAAAQTATLKWNGTAATTTAGTVAKLPGSAPPQGVAYTDSNVGSGTTGGTYAVLAGTTYVLDLTPFTLGSTGANTNLTVSTDGSCNISFTWSEY